MVRRALGLTALLLAVAPAAASAGKVTVYVEERVDLTRKSSDTLKAAALEAVRRAGHTPIDLAPVAGPLFRPGMLVPTFDAPPPQNWPEALRSDWETGHRGCRDRVQHEKTFARGITASQVGVMCQQQLARALYLRYAAHLAPDQILEVGVAKTSSAADAPVRVTAVLFSLDSPQGRRTSRDVPRTLLQSAVPELVSELLKGGGAAAPVNTARALPGRPGTRTSDPIP